MTEQQHEALLKTIRQDIDKADKEIVNAIDQRLQAVQTRSTSEAPSRIARL